MFDLSQIEKQSKQTALNVLNFNVDTFAESAKLFDKATNNLFNIYTLKATEAFATITNNVKDVIEKTEIAPLFGSGIKK
jgi:hypothetical protein